MREIGLNIQRCPKICLQRSPLLLDLEPLLLGVEKSN
jgi:hypothetical protein